MQRNEELPKEQYKAKKMKSTQSKKKLNKQFFKLKKSIQK
jgi:hypothetical protein